MKRASVFLLAFLIVSLSLTLIHPVFAAYIFSDGFEDEDDNFNTNWDGKTVAAGSTLVVAQDQMKEGADSAKAIIEAGDYARCYKNFGDNNVVYARMYVRFDNLITTDWRKIGFIEIRDANNGRSLLIIEIYHTTPQWRIIYRSAGSTTVATDTDSPPTADEWRCIEVKVNCSTNDGDLDGSYEVWVDGSSIWSVSGIDTDSTTCDEIRVGVTQSNDTVSNIVWVDCVVVDDEYIGVISEGEEKNFYGTINSQFTINHASTWTFNRYTQLNPTFTITSTRQFISAGILNFFGEISQFIGINFQKTIDFNCYTIINPTLTIDSSVISSALVNFFGSIIQQFTVTTTKAFSFTRYALINEIFTVTSIFEMPGILNLYGIINLVFDIVGYSPIAAPLTIDVVLGIAAIGFIIAIVALAVAINKKD